MDSQFTCSPCSVQDLARSLSVPGNDGGGSSNCFGGLLDADADLEDNLDDQPDHGHHGNRSRSNRGYPMHHSSGQVGYFNDKPLFFAHARVQI